MKLISFSFLADENIPPDLIAGLKAQNIDVKSVLEVNLRGKTDLDILKLANDQNRIVITQDSDFGRLIFTSPSDFVGVIFLRPGHLDASFHQKALMEILHSEIDVRPPFILVVENKGTSYRVRLRNEIYK